MYDECKYCVEINSDHSEPIFFTSGVKQGCNHSQMLANIYQNDLYEIFDDLCAPVKIADMDLSSMSWMDEEVLSESSDVLQGALYKLNDYCIIWGVQVNKGKTKCMVLGKKGTAKFPASEQISFQNLSLETVNCTRYLGLQICAKWNVSMTIEDRVANPGWPIT